MYELNGKKMNHFFDGLALVHKFEIKDGTVTYFNKLIETTAYKKSTQENHFGMGSYGTPDPCSTLFSRLKTLYNRTHEGRDNTNVNIVPFANRQMYALTETNFLVRVDPKSLNVTGKFSVTDKIPTSNTIIAHPHVLPDGSWIDMGVNLNKPGYDFVQYDGKGIKDPSLNNILENGKLINTIKSSTTDGFSYFHSFGLSQNYIIFLEMPLKLSKTKRLKGVLMNQSISDSFYMEPSFNTRVHLINRNTGQLVEQPFHTDPLFSYHHINAYEKVNANTGKTEILVDICAYNPDNYDINKLRYEDVFTNRLVNSGTSYCLARRITIPIESKKSTNSIHCHVKLLNSKHSLEFPIINYSKYNTLPYKYAYACNFLYKKPFSIVKINVDNQDESWERQYEMPTEPAFVENPNGTSEDDGVLLVMCQNRSEADYLSILDAKNMNEIARATLPVPDESRGGFAFHGFFADNLNYKDFN